MAVDGQLFTRDILTMNYPAIATSIYAAFVLIGGMIGFATAHSLPSLIMGISFAVLLGICAWGMFKGCKLSRIGALILALLLMGFFGYRFFIAYKFFPAGMMAILSLALALCLQFCKKAEPSTTAKS